MKSRRQNKRKIVNDPVYGFISIPSELIFDVIEHPYFQRLRRIKQLGLSYYVYPGATHTRFQHVLGAMHLMSMAVEALRQKGHEITQREATGAYLAILLHDIGHGPFSHTLESSFVKNISHEAFSLLFMQKINAQMGRKLQTCIEIFTGKHPKAFLHQLVSSQLDMDRLDYLRRDSFFSGVSEGVVGSDRIIKMLNIHNGQLVVEAKGIYSVEKFLIARRLMYWQVYLHKTVVVAELILVKILQRAKQLALRQKELWASQPLLFFLKNRIENIEFFAQNSEALEEFARLDDFDVFCAIKAWAKHPDKVLALLCRKLINRELFHIEIYPETDPTGKEKIELARKKAAKLYQISQQESQFFVASDFVSNNAYSTASDNQINILYQNNQVCDIAKASDLSNVEALSKDVKKYFLCYPKEITL